MASKFKEIFEYKVNKIEVDKAKIFTIINTELSKFNFEKDYLKEGKLDILSSHEVVFHSCTLENFTETRSISETNRPNKHGVQIGNKKISEFNSWDYKLNYKKEFQNSEDYHNIEESHHAIGCGTCKQQGKIRCSSCYGAGDVTCGSCSGRGEKQCVSCSGRGETKCWSCSGRGSKETGYGDNKRIERCSSCSGRGYKSCSSCSNGYITCSTCSGRGRVSCYTCHGAGEVTCYQCDGYRTMDHYFIVNANYINLNQELFVTNPFHGFDNLKANEIGFSIKKKLFENKENRFKDGYFEDLQLHPLFRQICTFFDFKDSDNTKLISSRITFYENKYFEVVFSFYGENYTIFLDQNLSNSYYSGKKPSDQYELDLLNKSLKSAINNELDVTKKTIQKLIKYDFINIDENQIIIAINDTQNIYKVKNEIDNRKYSNAESTLKQVSNVKKNELDFKILRKKLLKIYFLNTFIFWTIGMCAVYFFTKNKSINIDNFDFTKYFISNFVVSIVILILSSLLNIIIRNIHASRFLVIILIFLQTLFLNYDLNNKETESIQKIEPFKKIISVELANMGYQLIDIKPVYDKFNVINYFYVNYKDNSNNDNVSADKINKIKVRAFLDGTVIFEDKFNNVNKGKSSEIGVENNEIEISSNLISEETVNTLINNYYNDLNSDNFDANAYYSANVDVYINLKNITPNEINQLFVNSDFQNGKSIIIEDTLTFEESKEDLSYWSYWVKYSCYRPSKSKYQECDVKIVIGLDDKMQIRSYKEVKVENLEFHY